MTYNSTVKDGAVNVYPTLLVGALYYHVTSYRSHSLAILGMAMARIVSTKENINSPIDATIENPWLNPSIAIVNVTIAEMLNTTLANALTMT